MRYKHNKRHHKYIKIAMVIVTISVIFVLSVLPSFAIPQQTGGTFGGMEYLLYSRPSVGSVNDLATAVQNQIYFTNPMAYENTFLYPICITLRPEYDRWRITVIVHRGLRNSAPSVQNIPEEWGVKGATLHFDKAGSLYRYDWMIDGSGGLHCQQAVSMNMVDGIYTYKLYSNEQIMYLYRGVAEGLNDQFQFGNATIGSVDKWNNAMNAYHNGLGGGGFTQEDIDNAYDDGYMDGEQSGYHQGAQDGYANGYANGYDEGYSHSAGAEEIESAYEDGKADGVAEGYQNGKADGVAEGYANGYDVGYDNGLETGYQNGKADGLVEGYQNGKADGVTEGYANGYTAGYDTGYETGYDEGYDYGYNLGESVGSTEIDIGEIISAVPEGAKSIINGALGFEIFGINVAGTLTALLVVAIVAYVVRKLMSR